MSPKPTDQALNTLTVLRSYPAATPDSRVALVFVTKEAGTIAFEITELGVKALREALVTIETLLSQKLGRA